MKYEIGKAILVNANAGILGDISGLIPGVITDYIPERQHVEVTFDKKYNVHQYHNRSTDPNKVCYAIGTHLILPLRTRNLKLI